MIDLQEMLTYRRPHRSRSERKFINRFVRPVVERAGGWEDGFGNLICEVGHDTRMMYACHTDTVDIRSGRKRVFLTDSGHFVTDSTEECLGADDTTGVWIMLNLIESGKAGLYIFHRAEELGCLGSAWISANSRDLLEPVEWCLSLDRKGYGSIVTHQMGYRTASEQFSASLASEMALGMHSDTGGSYTDSIEYVDLVAECTNISVGYHHCHSSRETQHYGYALAILKALDGVDYDALVTGRTAGDDGVDDDGGAAYHAASGFCSAGTSTDHWNGDDRYLADKELDFPGTDASVLKDAPPFGMKYGDSWGDEVNPYWPEASDIEWG